MRWDGASRERWSRRAWPATRVRSSPRRRVPAQAVARYWPTTIPAEAVTPRIECEGEPVAASPRTSGPPRASPIRCRHRRRPPPPARARRSTTPRRRIWSPCRYGCSSAGDRATRVATPTSGCGPIAEPVARWLCDSFDVRQFKEALPESGPVRSEPAPAPQPPRRQLRRARHPRMGRRLQSPAGHPGQGDGGALRSRTVVVPSHLVSSGPPAARWSSAADLSDYAAARGRQRGTATGVNSQRRCLIPLMKVDRKRSGSEVAAMSGRRSKS